MRCKDFDAHIDEMLSGILHPDANQHMRECERCTSHFRSRAAVQNGLCELAAAALPGPSRATDRAVMDGFRRLQQRRVALPAKVGAEARPAARLLPFPVVGGAPPRPSRPWLTHSAAAALVFAVLGSGVYLWNGVTTVKAPTTGSPAIATQQQPAAASPARSTLAANAAANNAASTLVARRLSPRTTQPSSPVAASELNASVLTAAPSEAAVAPASANASVLTAESANLNSVPPAPANAASVLHLVGAAGNMAQSASSTWPGYSNLMYCDPVVCSGPMQVVHIKVPVGQVKPNLGQSSGNGFVNAEVVVGPDGVARAIRVAN
jgi:hypothetical protein